MRFFFSDFLYKGIVDAIQMSTHNICLYKEVKKKYIGCNLKTTEFLDCALIGVCAVIRSNTVYRLKYFLFILFTLFFLWFSFNGRILFYVQRFKSNICYK